MTMQMSIFARHTSSLHHLGEQTCHQGKTAGLLLHEWRNSLHTLTPRTA